MFGSKHPVKVNLEPADPAHGVLTTSSFRCSSSGEPLGVRKFYFRLLQKYVTRSKCSYRYFCCNSWQLCVGGILLFLCCSGARFSKNLMTNLWS